MIDWSDYRNFTAREMRCSCPCGRADMDPDFMAALQRVREAYGRPMKVTSGFRCPDYNAKISKTGHDGPHTTGKAADVAVSGEGAYHLLHAAIGMLGIGMKQHGPHVTRFLHLDTTDGPMRPRIWSYP